jgi:hypothetical protein
MLVRLETAEPQAAASREPKFSVASVPSVVSVPSVFLVSP